MLPISLPLASVVSTIVPISALEPPTVATSATSFASTTSTAISATAMLPRLCIQLLARSPVAWTHISCTSRAVGVTVLTEAIITLLSPIVKRASCIRYMLVHVLELYPRSRCFYTALLACARIQANASLSPPFQRTLITSHERLISATAPASCWSLSTARWAIGAGIALACTRNRFVDDLRRGLRFSIWVELRVVAYPHNQYTLTPSSNGKYIRVRTQEIVGVLSNGSSAEFSGDIYAQSHELSTRATELLAMAVTHLARYVGHVCGGHELQ